MPIMLSARSFETGGKRSRIDLETERTGILWERACMKYYGPFSPVASTDQGGRAAAVAAILVTMHMVVFTALKHFLSS